MFTAHAASVVTDTNAEQATSDLVEFFQIIITKIPLWIAAIIIVFFTFVLARIARRVVENKLAEKGLEEEHQEIQILMGRLTNSIVQVIGITAALKVAGIDITSIIAAGAFGIGFALKDLIMNFIAGMMILLGRHFSLGDFIKVGSTIGKVMEIQSRVTILRAIDGTKVIVPNSNLFKKEVTSFTSNPFRRVEILVKVDYRNNLDNVVKVASDILKNTKGVLTQPKPGVLIGTFGDNGVEIKLRAWCNARGGWLKVKSRLMLSVKEKFKEHGIRIARPVRFIHEDNEQDLVEKIMESEEAENNQKEQQQAEAQPQDQAPPANTNLQPALAAAGPTQNITVTGQMPVQPVQEQTQQIPAQASAQPQNPPVQNTPPTQNSGNDQGDAPLQPLSEQK